MHIISGASSFWIMAMTVVALTADDANSKPPPYGHKDFYPSPERPIGFRADGNGHYPGATPVTQWGDGVTKEAVLAPAANTPDEEDDAKEAKEPAKPQRGLVFVDNASRNVVWKTPLPGAGDAHPVVAGDRLIGTADPDWVFCLDVHTGKELWRDRLSPMTCLGLPAEEARRRQEVCDIARAAAWLCGKGDHQKTVAKCRELQERVRQLEPDPAILQGFDKQIELLEREGRGELVDGKKINLGNWPGMSNFIIGPVGRKYRVMLNQTWYGHVSLAAASPVTDGEFVFVRFGQGQTACYDLNGKRIWARLFAPTAEHMPGIATVHAASPLLSGGLVLVVNSDNASYAGMRGLDKRTGETRWETTLPKGGEYHSPLLLRVSLPDGEPMDVVATPMPPLLRASDGKVIGTLPNTGSLGNRSHRLGFGDLLWVDHSSGHGTSGPGITYRLKAVSAVQIDLDKVCELDCAGKKPGEKGTPFGNTSGTLTADGVIIGHGFTPSAWDFRTGSALTGTANTKQSVGEAVPTMIGPYYITPAFGWANNAYARRVDGVALAHYAVFDCSDPKQFKAVSRENCLGGTELPAHCLVDTYLADWDKNSFVGCYKGIPGAWWGIRFSGIVASGNRMFMQSSTFMYCIGDPTVAYDWNPASRPERITRLLAVSR